MKKIVIYLIIIFVCTFRAVPADGQVLDVQETIQEHSMWCWDASSVCILHYYGFVFTQCEIANWAFKRNDCCGESTFAWKDPNDTENNHPCNSGNYLYGYTNHDIDDILDHYGSIATAGLNANLTKAEVQAWIGLGTPFVMRFDWTGGGAHALVGHGIDGDDVYYMDPWPNSGFTINDYDFVVESEGHNWTRTLAMTTLPGMDFYLLNAVADQSCSAPGGSVNVSCEIHYTGLKLKDEVGAVNLGYYLRKSGSNDPSSYVFLGSSPSYLGTDNPNITKYATLDIPPGTDAGYYDILFVADYDQQFVENNENNNILGVTLWIDVIAPTLNCQADAVRYTDPGVCTFKLSGTGLNATASDNGTVTSITWIMTGPTSASGSNSLAGTTLNPGENFVTWTATDECGNSSTCKQKITIVDSEPPTTTCGPDALKGTDPGVCSFKVSGMTLDATATDNCGKPVTLTWALTGATAGSGTTSLNGTTFQLGETTVTWTAEDDSKNKISCTQIITVTDFEDPVITCKPGAIKSSYTGDCTYKADGTEFDATATDNCDVQYLSWNLSGATVGSGYTTLEGVEFNFGVTTVTWTAEDYRGNSSTCFMEVDVNKIITITTVTLNRSEQQYSDPVTFTATIQPGACTGAGEAATAVTFYVGDQPMGDPVPLLLEGGLLKASKTYPLLEYPGFEGTMDPDPAQNPKLITAEFSGIDPDFDVKDATTNLTVIPENGCAYYAGVYYASTGSPLLDKATVVLAVTIVEEDDGFPGEFLNNTTVRFYSDGSLITAVPALDAGEIGAGSAIGTASYEWPGVAVEVYDITAKVMGYYTNALLEDCDGEALVTVGKPTPDFITGGGFVTLENSLGLLAGTPGTKNNFGFVVKYNKKMTNLQGNLNTIVRRMEGDGMHLYKIKSNVLSSLAINENHATFTGKATIQDITDPLKAKDVAGNCILQFTLTDNGEPGSNDLISITVWKSDGGMWFTTRWDDVAYRPVEQLLDGGNLVVHSAADDGGEEAPVKPPKKKVATINPQENNTLQVYPNPFSRKLFFDLTPLADLHARLEIFDVTGRKVTTLLNRQITGGLSYHIEYQPQNEASHLLIYRLTLGDQTFNGKVFYKK